VKTGESTSKAKTPNFDSEQ